MFCSFQKVGDVRVRFSFAGLSSEASALGPAQTVSLQHGAFSHYLGYTEILRYRI